MADPRVCIRRAGPDDVDALLTTEALVDDPGLGRPDSRTSLASWAVG